MVITKRQAHQNKLLNLLRQRDKSSRLRAYQILYKRSRSSASWSSCSHTMIKTGPASNNSSTTLISKSERTYRRIKYCLIISKNTWKRCPSTSCSICTIRYSNLNKHQKTSTSYLKRSTVCNKYNLSNSVYKWIKLTSKCGDLRSKSSRKLRMFRRPGPNSINLKTVFW